MHLAERLRRLTLKDEQKIAVCSFVFWKSRLSRFTDQFWKMCHLPKLRARDRSFCNHCHRFSSKHYRRINFDQTTLEWKQLLSKGSRFVKTSAVSSQTSSSQFANVINLVKRVYSTCIKLHDQSETNPCWWQTPTDIRRISKITVNSLTLASDLSS